MRTFRIAKTPYAKDLSGFGARLYGGRWNNPGIAVIYTAESRALAALEYLVHTSHTLAPANLCLATFEIPDTATIEEITSSALPRNWRSHPPSSELADLGTEWLLSKRSLMLRVPSAIVEQEHNILINPAHTESSSVIVAEVERYSFDERLLL